MLRISSRREEVLKRKKKHKNVRKTMYDCSRIWIQNPNVMVWRNFEEGEGGVERVLTSSDEELHNRPEVIGGDHSSGQIGWAKDVGFLT